MSTVPASAPGNAEAILRLAEATRRQGEASHPAVSAWVSANAGSGKTHVLAQRVIRLLLTGVPPGRILCLTYTKAAAANMANRVLSILGRWVTLTDAELDAEIARTDHRPPTPDLRALARRLFAAALETPGGLKIQTIHAFCGGLLHQFPFEAGVAAGFRELDDVARMDLMARIRTELIVDGSGAPDGALGQALSRLMEEMSDASVDALLEAAVAARAQILPLAEDASARRARVAQVLGVPPGTTRAGVEAEMLNSPHLPRSEWASVAASLSTSDKATDQKRAAAFSAAAAASAPAEMLAAYLDIFLKSDGNPRSDRDLLTKGAREAFPSLALRMDAERDRIAALQDLQRATVVLERTEAALTLGAAACARYEAEKAARGVLDFDDLINRSADLLHRVPASWVHFKLDRGIDHVLVDEAQDTSPNQWKVVQGLISDFFSGSGARPDAVRTLFVVGDEKQSIFSFQGADPRTFGAMHTRVAGEVGAEGFRDVQLPHSFRSAPGVLEAVDAVFAQEDARAGLTSGNQKPTHAAIRADAPAQVEIWPTVTPPPKPKVDDWRRPLDEVPGDDPVNVLARRIAGFVRSGIQQRFAIPSRKGRPMQARDVLVLVRRRGKLFEAIIRALKSAGGGVEVAGADRLVVADHIAALDLMALGDALLSPDDDLALAGVLKSPLFGFTDTDLMTLCPEREGRLGTVLAARTEPVWREAQARLDRWRGEAPLLRPFDFYARVLGRDGGRRAMLARLGAEAADVLDEFMALARAYEGGEAATLAGFLAFLRRGGAETKRDMESGRDEVRVMTVHGAKGLEAPIVILADTVDVPKSRTAGGLLTVIAADGSPVPVLAARKSDDPAALTQARADAAAREGEEYRRLLYVALTRAEDAVIVCGAEGRVAAKDKPHARAEGCWYDLVLNALAPDAHPVSAPYGDGDVLRWRRAGDFAVSVLPAPVAVAGATPHTLVFPPYEPPRAARPVRPSHSAPREGEAKSARGPVESAEALDPILRGDLVHRLLAGLADVSATERGAAGQRMLDHAAAPLSPIQHQSLLDEALGVLGHAALADLFGAGSVAEVPVVGRWTSTTGRAVTVSCRLDRLAVRGDALLLVDFKTDRIPPADPQDIGAAYVSQIALYGEVLRRAFPGKTVEARIVYTRGPRIHRLAPDRLAAALRDLERA